MNFMTLLMGMGGTAASGSTGTTQQNPLSMILIMGVMFGAMYIFMIRPQKKKQKEEQQMRDSLQIGDEITTIGGIVGRVVTIKDDDTLIIETGSDRNKMKITRWAMQTNNTANEKAQAERAAAEEAKKAERDAKIEAEGKKFAKKKKKNKDEE